MTDLPKIGRPATRALAEAGVTELEQLAQWSEAALLGLHGVGPRAIGIVKPVLEEHGLAFKPDDPQTKPRKTPSAP